MENKQTAVDLLSKWIIKNIVVHTGDLDKVIEKAKQMEEQQMFEEWKRGFTEAKDMAIENLDKIILSFKNTDI